MQDLLFKISQCTACVPHLVLGPRPVLSADAESRIIIIGQAPGTVVHKSGIPWDDKSGENLRNWMGRGLGSRLPRERRISMDNRCLNSDRRRADVSQGSGRYKGIF